MAVAQEGNHPTPAADRGLVEVEEAQVAQEPQAQMNSPPHLTLVVMADSQQSKIRRGLAELMVIH